MNFKILTCAAGILLMSVTSSFAITLDFTFSFINESNGGGTVTGIVRGLLDDATSAATSVEVTGNTSGFGLGEFVGNPVYNEFTVDSGIVTYVYFLAFGSSNQSPANTTSSIQLRNVSGLENSSTQVHHTTHSLLFTAVPISAVPLPPGLVLFLTGLVGFGVVGRWKKRAV